MKTAKGKDALIVFRKHIPKEKKSAENLLYRRGPPLKMKGGDPAKIAQLIIRGVEKNGTRALLDYTRRFDKARLTKGTVKVKSAEFDRAMKNADQEVLGAMRRSIKRITSYHKRQIRNSWMENGPHGEIRGMNYRPLHRVGVNVPGGLAPLPSTLLMCVLPAKVVGVPEVIVVTPPDAKGKINPYILVAARLCGVKDVFKVGGAQAMAALAFGTPPLPKVDKIVGPGNAIVSEAKRRLFGAVDIDGFYGPSEIMILADASATPALLAADLLGQAEHDPLAVPILVTTAEIIARAVIREIRVQLSTLPRRDIAEKSLARGMIYVVDDIDEAIDCANIFAPEHLEICVANPHPLMAGIENAGAVFLGNFTPEVLGDYYAGPNHCLPTSGTARFSSPLSCDDFIKATSFISYTKEALLAAADDVMALARLEGLDAHAMTVERRIRVKD